ncbi:MAG: restriction endonuclease subunit S (plasmid) [Stenomitos frigidus ULC029]
MGNEWKIVPTGDLCTGIYDGPHATPKKTNDGPIFLGISNLSQGRIDLSNTEHLSEEDFVKWTRRITPQPGDVVFSYETRLGEVGLIPEGLKCCLGRRMALMRPNPSKADSRFLLYAYLSPEFQATIRARTIHGSTVDRIPLIEFPSFPIRVPPLDEQKAIAHILGTLDDKIELNQQMNHTLESIARALFKSWFIDFDPVRAKLDRRQPAGMDAETAALFPAEFEAGGAIGKIPKDWKVKPIGDAVKTVGGATPSTSEPAYWEEGSFYWSTPKDLAPLSSPVLLDTERRITEKGLQKISSGLLPKGTLLLSSRAPIGYLAIAEIPLAINQGYIAIVCGQELSNHYVLRWVQFNMDVIEGRANGTTFMEISKKNFRPIPALVPPQQVLQVFNNQAEFIHQQVVNNLRQNKTLASIRDALLPKLLSGEIRVQDAEKVVEAVV